MAKLKKLSHFEGLRGFAALIVVFHHLEYALGLHLDRSVFTFFQKNTESELLSGIIQSILNFFINGELAIYIFFFMSGYVISIRLFDSNKKYLSHAISKRYFRLMPPILGSVLLAYLLMKFNLMYNNELATFLNSTNGFGQFYQFNPNFLAAFKSGIWNILFTSNLEGYNGPLWTMRAEFYGSIICFLFYAIFNKLSFRFLIYPIVVVGAYYIETPWLSAFILGLMFCDIDHSQNKFNYYMNYFENKILSRLIFVIPTSLLLLCIGRENYEWFTPAWPCSKLFSSSLIVIIAMKSQHLKKLFSAKPLFFLGKISFSMYLLHWPIICSLTSYCYLQLNLGREINILITAIVTFITIIPLSYLYTKYIDGNTIVLANRIGFLISEKIHSLITKKA